MKIFNNGGGAQVVEHLGSNPSKKKKKKVPTARLKMSFSSRVFAQNG
jgi:hypothetical protein